jgi:hypothetical protein
MVGCTCPEKAPLLTVRGFRWGIAAQHKLLMMMAGNLHSLQP